MVGLVSLPTEILLEAVGAPAPGSIVANWNRLDDLNLLCDLSLVCRRFHNIFNPLIYERVVLRRYPYYVNNVTARRSKYDGFYDDPNYFFSADRLVLLLQTLVESPRCREMIREIDCRIYVRELPPDHSLEERWPYVESGKVSYKTYILKDPKSISRSWARCARNIRVGRSSPENYARSVLEHVGLASPAVRWVRERFCEGKLPEDLGERIFAAILCLATGLRSLVVWCPICCDHSDVAGREKPSFRYPTLDRLITSALASPVLQDATLPNLKSVRLDRDYRQDLLSKADYRRCPCGDPLPDLPLMVDTCLGILRAPQVTAFQGSYDTTAAWKTIIETNRNITQLTFAPGSVFGKGNPELPALLELVSEKWELQDLVYQCPLADRSPELLPAVKPEHVDVMLKNLSTSLVSLNFVIQTFLTDCYKRGLPPPQLEFLPSMARLEHLQMSLPMLVGDKPLDSVQLERILPPTLKSLHIADEGDLEPRGWYGSYARDVFDTAPNGLPEPEETDIELKRDLPGVIYVLTRFAQVCGRTHPKLRSVVLQDGWELYAEYWGHPKPDPINEHERRLRDEFKVAGVAFKWQARNRTSPEDRHAANWLS
ncbi:hypothetical protein B0T19DRAFT_432603 [Cercophora scortea]|uniref:F-box domain-containing protein n=1 Tax=Cercophora scortea TaxID=314031 RepID=A0AAE0M5J4_9PEZI|nr:hypothetical protein B0T19DRAFT_432603 [Cercophora scortea]